VGQRIFDELATSHPTNLHFLEEQAYVHASLGVVYQNSERPEKAEQALRRAVRHYDRLVQAHPTVPDYAMEFGEVYVNLGALVARKGQTVEALECDTQAIRFLRRALTKFPDDGQILELLKTAHSRRSQTLARLASEVKSVETYSQAAAGQEALASEFPAVLDYTVDAAAVYCGVGGLLREKGQPKAALPWYAKAIATLEGLQAPGLEQAAARKSLRDAYAGRAEALAALRPQAEAADDWTRALQLDDGTKRAALQLQRAFAYARAGTPTRALEDVESLLEREKDPSASLLCDLARVCALGAVAARDDPPAAQKYAARAVDLLRRAVHKGYRDGKRLKTDPDLQPLNSRPDFQELLRELLRD